MDQPIDKALGIKKTDEQKRKEIPRRESIPTLYSPVGAYLMLVPLPDVDQVGHIIIPNAAQRPMNEGHLIEKGPMAPEEFEIGDCLTWDANSEMRMNIDGHKFVLVGPQNILMRVPWKKLDPNFATVAKSDIKIE